MALTLVEAADVTAWSTAIANEAGATPLVISQTITGTRPVTKYMDRLDRVYGHGRDVGSSHFGYFDPRLEDPGDQANKFFTTIPDITGVGMHVGEWDRAAGTQLLYAGETNTEFFNYDPDTHAKSGAQLFQHAGSPVFGRSQYIAGEGPLALGTTDDGYWSGNSQHWVFFESLGFAVCNSNTVRLDGLSRSNVLIKVDLTAARLGEATPLGVPGEATTSAATPYNEPPIAGDNVVWRWLQFVPDDDSTPANPKGRLFNGDDNPQLDAGSTYFYYLRIYEWNPNGIAAKPGNPSRTHLRELVTSRLEFDGTLFTDPDQGVPYFHPPTGQLVFVSNLGTNPVSATVTGLRFSLDVQPAIITTPSQLEAVETADTASFSTEIRGSLGEQAAGVTVDFSIARESEVREPLDTAGFPATSTVDFPPIDTLGTLAEGTLVVYDPSDTVLDETTDYTVNLNTGVITWQGAHPTAESGYTASYKTEQQSSPRTPAHGTLLTATARTDETGRAIAQVRYADDDFLADNAVDTITAAVTF